MNLSWLNPVNWIKSGFAAGIDNKVDNLITAENLEAQGREIVNYLIQLSDSKVADDKLETIANDLIYAGESLIDLGKSIHPKSEEGRKLSETETKTLNARVKVLFGDVIHDWDLSQARAWIKSNVRKAMGLEG